MYPRGSNGGVQAIITADDLRDLRHNLQNITLREELQRRCPVPVRIPPPKLCTDNAAMIGVLAERKLLKAIPATSVDAEIEPSWSIG